MAITFIDIERQKNWRIGIFFLVLIVMYFLIAAGLVLTFHPGIVLQSGSPVTGEKILFIFLFSTFVASIHFYFSASNAVQYIKDNLGAVDPDPEDELHKRLLNIMDEIHVAAGNREKIVCAVIPSLSMNALSAVDLKGNALVAITEGLISRLSREQTEAVIAHEAYHILSGDCLESTVAASLFGLPSSIMEKMQTFSRGRAFFSPAYLFSFIMLKLGYLLNMFISREREYRADAGAVRMTRNPLALAEVLYLLSRNWRGTGSIGGGLEMLCIVNPEASALDESEGWLSDLLSTHPPIRKRVAILLEMAHAGIAELEERRRKEESVGQRQSSGEKYYALDRNYVWQGPFTFAELAALPWFTTLTWISKGGEKMVKATEVSALADIFRARMEQDRGSLTDHACPLCWHPLVKNPYENTRVYQCRHCGGTMVENNKLPRIIARRDNPCTERIKEIARTTLRENQVKRIARKAGKGARTEPPISCPRCKAKMMRIFYSYAYLVEIDRCGMCGATWFDRDELEMLQCMIDGKIASRINLEK